jgi:hypothetical protein
MSWCDWEDFAAGMYATGCDAGQVTASALLLGDPDAFHEAAREMVREWPASAHHNLHNMWTGRNAWVGQATCCYSLGSPAQATRDAWGTLTLDQQRAANAVAVAVRIEWEARDVGQTLFTV